MVVSPNWKGETNLLDLGKMLALSDNFDYDFYVVSAKFGIFEGI